MVAIIANMIFLVTSLIFFVDQIMTNFLELSFITTEDFGTNRSSQSLD